MNQHQYKENGIPILELSGRFDAHAADSVRDQLGDLSAGGVVDMSGVNFIDSTALAVLVQGMKRCREAGGDLILCNLQQATRIIFELTRFDRAFTICSQLDEATSKLSPSF